MENKTPDQVRDLIRDLIRAQGGNADVNDRGDLVIPQVGLSIEFVVKPKQPGQTLPRSRSWDAYFMGFARHAATRGTCTRKAVGCCIVLDKHVVSTGYNGSPPGLPHCTDPGVGCLVTSTQYPDQAQLQDHCIRAVHAEANALLQAAMHGHRVAAATAYTTASPCRACMLLLMAAGISRVVYAEAYRLDMTQDLALAGGILYEVLK